MSHPRVVIEGSHERTDWRIVRREFTNEQTGETLIEDVTEVSDGKDAMGHTRWKTLTRSRDGAMGDWIRIAEGLKAALIAAKEL